MLLHDGTRFWCGPTSDEEYAEIVMLLETSTRLGGPTAASTW